MNSTPIHPRIGIFGGNGDIARNNYIYDNWRDGIKLLFVPAAFLRGFRALYLGIAINLIIMGWVTRAMIKILTISLGISPLLAVGTYSISDQLERGQAAPGHEQHKP